MQVLALGTQSESLGYAEAMLLVDHRESQRGERRALLEQGVGPQGHPRFPGGYSRAPGFALLFALASREPCDLYAERGEPIVELAEMLLGKYLGGSHHCSLHAVLDRAQGCEHRNDGLAAADVTLEQSVHGVRLRQIALDILPRSLLRPRQLKGQPIDQRRGIAALGSEHRGCS